MRHVDPSVENLSFDTDLRKRAKHRLCDGIGKRGEPDRNFGWIIVHDVVDARFAFERRRRSRRGVRDVDPGPDAAS